MTNDHSVYHLWHSCMFYNFVKHPC